MSVFPAILIGGPPHSGKSVLVYSLTQALRRANVPHYALRACPDAEGDWSNEADQALVRTIRPGHKGPFTPAFTARVAGYLQNRHLPLLVDVGGKPTPEQEEMFRHCTGAVLLVADRPGDPDAYARDLAHWQAMMTRQGVPVIAQLKSVLQGANRLHQTRPFIAGTIANLERGETAVGPVFDALVADLSARFAYPQAELTARHLAGAPVELTLDLPALARTLGAPDGYWQPEQLPALSAYLPHGKPLAIYGRAPNWIYAALALVAHPAPVWLYDVRLGWVEPPLLPTKSDAPAQAGWEVTAIGQPDYTWLAMTSRSQYLDITAADRLPLVDAPTNKGLILSGKIPHWLLLAAARQLAPQMPWTAVYQPPLDGAVVVGSETAAFPLGRVISASPPE